MSHSSDFLVSSREYFTELVVEGCSETGLATFPQATNYLVDILIFYMNTENLFDEEDLSGRKKRGTLAEMMLKAGSAQREERVGLLKKLGDTALYVSGFFGESLQRKVVDIDYYMEMGETAYGSLAASINESSSAKVFDEFSRQFVGFVDVLTYISSKSIRPMSDNLLQLFETYVSTGSKTAQGQIFEKGLVTIPVGLKKYKQ